VVSVLGEGGMGRVYKAVHILTSRLHAVKIMRPDHASDSVSVVRFQKEAQVATRIDHPNCVGASDFGSWEGLLYLVMDYVPGPSLASVLKVETKKVPLPLKRALPIFRQICSGLQAVHDKGIIHRDVKSSNVILVESAV
jgi:serine/threonine-protein kinase